MLIRYKNNYEKIAMGLLSFMPDKKDVKNLLQTIQKYEREDSWQLYLWKQDEDILGAVGIKIVEDMSVIIQHITVDPSHRNHGVGKQMIRHIIDKYSSKYEVIADEQVSKFYQKCIESES